MNSKLEEINDGLRNLEKLPSQLKIMEARQDLISKIMGYIFEVTKVDEGEVIQIQKKMNPNHHQLIIINDEQDDNIGPSNK